MAVVAGKGDESTAAIESLGTKRGRTHSARRMDLLREDALLPIIQLSITPVILMTALGSLLLTMTNRLGRVVDRTRSLAGSARLATGTERTHLDQQLRVLFRRAGWVRLAVTFNAASLLCAGLLVVVLFIGAVTHAPLVNVVVGLFFLSVAFLVASLAAFLRDIFMSLTALSLEVHRALDQSAPKSNLPAKTR
jgi:hypothetical protein